MNRCTETELWLINVFLPSTTKTCKDRKQQIMQSIFTLVPQFKKICVSFGEINIDNAVNSQLPINKQGFKFRHETWAICVYDDFFP